VFVNNRSSIYREKDAHTASAIVRAVLDILNSVIAGVFIQGEMSSQHNRHEKNRDKCSGLHGEQRITNGFKVENVKVMI
jgi:hypothetical protein